MPTLLLPPRLNEDCATMRRVAERAGWRAVVGNWRIDPGDFPEPGEIAVYADSLYADVAASRLGLALVDVPPDWLPGLPQRWRRRDVLLTSLAGARRLTAPRFVKPPDDKSFPARVYARGEDLPGDDLLEPQTPVLVAEPVTWEVEFRCFVLGGEVVASSVYFRDGELARDDTGDWQAESAESAAALAFVREVLSDPEVAIPHSVVLDVGRIAGRGWAVVEANPAWGSGLYGSDPASVLPVLRAACVARSDVPAALLPWLRPPVTVEDS